MLEGLHGALFWWISPWVEYKARPREAGNSVVRELLQQDWCTVEAGIVSSMNITPCDDSRWADTMIGYHGLNKTLKCV